MIKFHGVELTDVAPVKIDDIVVSPIALNPVERPRAIKFGSDFVRMGGGTRKITITFALLDMDRETREQAMDAIRSWAFTETEQTMELPQFATRHLECICTKFPDHSYRKWWEDNISVEFTCFNNPYWTSNEEMIVACGTRFTVGGSAPPLMVIERRGTAPLTNATYSTGSVSMMFTRIPAGTCVIDLNKQTASIGSTSFMQYYSPTSTWITPTIGALQIINGNGTIKFRERWV